MKSYKVCVATSKYNGKVIAGLTSIVETDEEPKDLSLENEGWYFDYYFFESEEKAKEFIKGIK